MQTNKSGGEDQMVLTGMEHNNDIIESVDDLTADDVERLKKKRPKTLGIVCGRSDCKNNLHCFDTSASKLRFPEGTCRSCGVNLVNWKTVHLRDIHNVDETFEYLKKEWIRHFFFHVPISPRIELYARRHGLENLSQVIEHHLRQGKMLRFNPDFDWQQTAMLDGTIVHWARHATASCCRACMKYWHNIPFDHELTAEDIGYFKQLGLRYIKLRLPDLAVTPIKKSISEGAPGIRRKKA